KIRADEAGYKIGCLDKFKFTIDPNIPYLIGHNRRRIAKIRQVASHDLDVKVVVWTIAEGAHDVLRLGAALFHIGIIAGKLLHHFLWHRPLAFRGRQQGGADVALTIPQDIDNGLAVERQRDCPTKFRIVEWWFSSDGKIHRNIHRIDFANRLRHLAAEVFQHRHGNLIWKG